MATAFIVLAYVRIVPYWLTILVISRDIFILVGVSLYLLLLGDTGAQPTALSKANTVAQIFTITYFLAAVAFPETADALGAGEASRVARGIVLLCAATTAASGAQYVYLGIRKLSRG
jgi:cardiolipin synthase